MPPPNISKSIGFTGTRQGLTDLQKLSLHDHLSALRRKFDWFHHGDCIGADAEAHEIARRLGYRIAIHPPLDKKYEAWCCGGVDYVFERLEYLERNHIIVDCSAVLIAMPKGMTEEVRSSTWATVRYARSVRKTIMILRPELTVVEP